MRLLNRTLLYDAKAVCMGGPDATERMTDKYMKQKWLQTCYNCSEVEAKVKAATEADVTFQDINENALDEEMTRGGAGGPCKVTANMAKGWRRQKCDSLFINK